MNYTDEEIMRHAEGAAEPVFEGLDDPVMARTDRWAAVIVVAATVLFCGWLMVWFQ